MNIRVNNTSAFESGTATLRPHGDPISSLGKAARYVRVPRPGSDWAEAVEVRLNELTSLPKGWDGYDGVAVLFTCAQFASSLMEKLFVPGVKAPQLVPGSNGTLQIEWHLNNFDLEIEVLAPYRVIAMRRDLLKDTEEAREFENDFAVLAKWVKDLGKARGKELTEAA